MYGTDFSNDFKTESSMKKLLFETDKQLHILACFSVAIVVALVMRKCGNTKLDAALYGWVAAFIVAVLKGVYDEIKYKGADKGDWMADIIGFTMGAVIALCTMM